jgi:aminoglycoside/choline kinase family phosphotransferase
LQVCKRKDRQEVQTADAEDGEQVRERVRRLACDWLGGRVVALEPIAAGLGTRAFLRIRLAGGKVSSAIARIEMPEDPGGRPLGVPAEPSLEPLRGFLEAAGIPVPRSYGVAGAIQLLEDVGEQSLEAAAHVLERDERQALYREAAGLVPRLQALSAPPEEIPAFGRHLDASLFAYKADLFVRWALPLALDRAPSESEQGVVREAFRWISDECETAPQRLSHRDFKAANLHVLRDTPAGPRLKLIDLQGAFRAPPEYDLMCLFRDSHVCLPEAEVQGHLDWVRPNLPDAPDPEVFTRRFTLLTLTRVGKDLARYLYAAQTRGDGRYLPLVPRAVSILHGAVRRAAPWHTCLDRLAQLILELPDEVPTVDLATGTSYSNTGAAKKAPQCAQ